MAFLDFRSATQARVRSAQRRAHAIAVTTSATLLLLLAASTAQALNPPPVQTFFVPVPEDQVFDALGSIYPGGGTCGGGSTSVQNPITTVVSIAVGFDGTLVYYDQWEDGGYDSDIANPANLYSSPGNLGGTQIWGDGDTSNGTAPGFPSDLLSAGDIIVLDNNVNTGNLSAIDFDGRDKIGASAPIAVTRAAWANGPGTLLAGAVEVYSTSAWGTSYEAPVGQDTASQNSMFEYTGLAIMAAADNTLVEVDEDGNGTVDTSTTLDQGESLLIDGGIDEGGTVTSSKPVQVDLITGDICATYETRWFTLLPTNQWSDSAYSPVSTNGADSTYVFVHNPGPGSITVMWETTGGSQPSAVVAAGATAQFELTDGSGAHFFTNDGSPFFAVATVDSEPISSNSTNDWGFAMIPASSLTQQALVGWGPGQDPTQPITENGAPVWVTPVANGSSGPFDICADYDGDGAGPLTDPFGNHYDELLVLDELEQGKIFDSDGDQTGMIVYVCDGSSALIAVAWGQDPDTASAGVPAIDVGTTIPPLPALAAGKGATLFDDTDGDNHADQGETLEYSVVIQNASRAPVTGVVLEDTVPAQTAYVVNSTEADDGNTVTAIPDAGVTAFPLDEGGVVLPAIPAAGELVVTFQVTIDVTADVCGEAAIVNQATVTGPLQSLRVDASTDVYCNPDIHIEKSTNGSDADTPTGPVLVEGSTVNWQYVVTNPGDVPLANVIVTDDQGVMVTPVDVNNDTFNDGDADLDGLLDPGEVWLYEASSTAALGQYANIGTATGEPVDEGGTPITDGDGAPFTNPTDDDPSHYLGVPDADLSIDKVDNEDPVVLGAQFTYTITVTNDGPSDATGVVVTDTLDPNTSYVSDTGGCIHSLGTLTCNLGNLANGAQTSFDVTVLVSGSAPTAGTLQDGPCDGSEDLCNEASVTANEDDSDPSDNDADEPTNVVECLTDGDCDDGVACTIDACVADQCQNTPDDGSCSDGQYCNGLEICDPSLDCQAGTAVDCDDGVSCTIDACDEIGDQCAHMANDNACGDGLYCNGVETCDPSLDCQAGTAVDCDDGVSCTADSCNEATDQCDNVTNDAVCDDGQYCNGVETCDPSLDCQAGTPVACDDGVTCTVDACNEATEQCDNTPTNALCDDGSYCNGAETCSATLGCQAGSSVVCNDGVPCTVDVCNETTDSCNNVPNDVLCNDPAYCNGVETCDVLLGCQFGTPVDCDDGVSCTTDACNEATDSCDHTADDAVCQDGQFCNGAEVCSPSLDCQAGTPVSCDDGVSCTTDACNESTDQCDNTPNDTFCTDGQYCNGVETCDPVLDCQAGTPPDCGDSTDCLLRECNEIFDSCDETPINEGDPCDDGDFCTIDETCMSGMCVPAEDTCGDGVLQPICGEQCDPSIDPMCNPDCTAPPGTCGDGVLDPGEECEPPSNEICNDMVDNDGDNLIDCADPDCAPNQNEECPPNGMQDTSQADATCGLLCEEVPGCKPLLNDPAQIRFASDPSHSLWKIHGRVLLDPPDLVDLVNDGFGITLTNSNGLIYAGQLLPGDLIDRGKGRYKFQDKGAKHGIPVRDGLYQVRLRFRRFPFMGGNPYFLTFKVKAYGDFSAATEARMTTQIYGVDEIGYLTACWTQKPRGWKLALAELF